jgi:hypothetical protein
MYLCRPGLDKAFVECRVGWLRVLQLEGDAVCKGIAGQREKKQGSI